MAEPILDPVLTIEGVYEAMKAAGYNVTLRSVRRLAHDDKLPFRRGPDNKTLFIKVSELKRIMDEEGMPEMLSRRAAARNAAQPHKS